jgi:hypothetical protein
MTDSIVFVLLIAYIIATYILLRFLRRRTRLIRPFIGIGIMSFSYALFWGIGVAGSGGEPGFALPAPNLLAMILMSYSGFYQGVFIGSMIFGAWWVGIFSIMSLRHYLKKRQITSTDDVDD